MAKDDLANITTFLPAGPYSYQTTAREGDHHGKGHVYIVDATGKRLASLWGPPDVKMGLAELIINAREKQP